MTPTRWARTCPPVDLGPGVTAIAVSAGSAHTCALTSDGGIKCWGASFRGALGLGDTNYRGDNPNEMGTNLPFVDLGPGVTVTTVRTGASHTCAVLTGGSIKCWGNNFAGQLGLGDIYDRGDEPYEMGDYLPTLDL